MIDKIKKIFKPKNILGVGQRSDSKIFVLSHLGDEIGFLKYLDKQWVFVYSQWFKDQNRIQPLIEFPDKNKVYKTNALWSFFSTRIPSNKQPKIIELTKTKEKPNLAILLEKFGKQTVNNPFVLEPK